MPHELPEKKKWIIKIKKEGIYFLKWWGTEFERGKKITLRNDRYLDIQNINNNNK